MKFPAGFAKFTANVSMGHNKTHLDNYVAHGHTFSGATFGHRNSPRQKRDGAMWMQILVPLLCRN